MLHNPYPKEFPIFHDLPDLAISAKNTAPNHHHFPGIAAIVLHKTQPI
jgi:hypothetical protein